MKERYQMLSGDFIPAPWPAFASKRLNILRFRKELCSLPFRAQRDLETGGNCRKLIL